MGPRSLLELILLAALWGGSFLFMRIAAPALGVVWLIALRLVLAGLVLLPIAARSTGLLKIMIQNWRSLLVVGCINLAVPFSLFAFASLFLPAGFTSILNATVPLFGTMIAILYFKEKLTLARCVGFVLGFVGVMILVGWRSLALTPTFLAAVGAGLLAALLYAIAALYIKARMAALPALAIATGSQFGGLLWLLPLLPFTMPQDFPAPNVIGALLALSMLSTALASMIYLRLIKTIGPTKTLTVTYLIPIFAIIWSAIVLGEPLTVSMLFGGGLVLLGTAISAEILRL